MTWLTVLQFANYLIPLFVIPYIVRVLGAEMFGKITYAQNIISYFTLLVNFGFEYSATRQIAVNKGNKNAIKEIFWSVIIQKLILLIISFLGLLILYLSFYKVHNDFVLYLFVFLMNVGIVLFPTWFFQGIEDMGKMAIFNVIIKGTGLLLTVFFVRYKADYLLYPFLTSLAYFVCGFISIIYVVKTHGINFTLPNIKLHKKIFAESSPIFLNNLFVSGYTIANMTILGFYVSDIELGYYSGAFKIIMAILMVTSTPITMSIFPTVSRKFSESSKEGIIFFKKIMIYLAIISVVVSSLTFFSSKLLVNLILGEQFVQSINILKLFSTLPVLVIFASLFTVQGVYGAGLQKYAPWIGLSLGLFCVIFDFITIPLWGIYGAAWGWIISEFFEIIIAGVLFYFGIKKMKI